MTESYVLPNSREISSQVLMKLEPSVLPKLPVACKTCPSAMWQITGKPDRPEAVTARCYCPLMHTFTWDSRNQEEILDCDQLYRQEDEDEAPLADTNDVPAFLRQQQERHQAAALDEHVPGEGFELET